MSQEQPSYGKAAWVGPYLGCGRDSGNLKASQTVLARLMESQIWHQLASSVGGGLEKGQWPLLALMPDTSIPSFMPLVPFKLLATRVQKLRGSDSE